MTTPSKLTTAAGVVSLRSVALPQARANAFAACLEANPRFSGASVHETKPGSNRFYVAFLPARQEAQESIFLAYQQEQIERATREMDGYEWNHLGGPHWQVTTLPDKKTGCRNVYYLHATALTCSCPHFLNRLAATGVCCKHLCSLFACQPGAIPVDTSQVKPVAVFLPDWGEESEPYDDFMEGGGACDEDSTTCHWDALWETDNHF